MELEVKLNPKSLKNFKIIKDDISDGLLKGVRKSMFFVEASSKKRFGTKDNLNIRSGRLRSSIKTSVKKIGDEIHGTIGSSVIYAAIHEYGTSRIIERPFIEPAFDENTHKINKIIMNSVKKEVN